MRNNKKKAFTLVEMLIVIAIIGILFIVLVANVDFSSNSAKESGVQNTFHAYQVACESVGLQYNGFTNDKEQLVKYLNKKLDSKYRLTVSGSDIVCPVEDPWGQQIKVVYSEPIDSKGQIRFISAGPDEEYDTADDIMTQIRCTINNDIMIETPKNDPNHTHDFTQQVALPEFLYQAANCQQVAKYYISCTCGARGDSVFDFGAKDFDKHLHTTEAYIPNDENTHMFTISCIDCGNVSQSNLAPHQDNGSGQCIQCGDLTHRHEFVREIQSSEFKKNDASCSAPLTYFKSCSCGQKGTATFTVGTALAHDFTKRTLDYPVSGFAEATCASPAKYYLTCTYCNAKGTETYEHGTRDESNHVGGEIIRYENIDDTKHTKKVICMGCGISKSETIENHFEGCGCHTHQYTEEVVMTDYLKTNATCTGKAVYYKSCECGRSSQDTSEESTFETGSVLGHAPSSTATWNSDHSIATVKCTRCTQSWSGHSSKNVTTTPNCTTDEKYQHSATVNVNGTNKTFTCSTTHTGSKATGTHTGSIVTAGTASACKWYSCCHTVTTATHTGGAAATCTTPQKCTVCNYVMVAAKGHSGNIVLVGTENVHSKYSGCGHTYSSEHDFGVASCTQPQSCSCGFSTGSGLGHAPSSTATWDTNHTKATVACTRTGCTQTWSSTTVNTTTTRTATCTLEQQYKHTATFNVNGESKTFTCTSTHTGSKDTTNHTGSIVNAKTASACKWYSCCNFVTDSSHSYNLSAATCTEAKKCNDCGYVAQAAKGHSGSPVYPSGGGTASVHQVYSGCGHTYSTTHNYGSATCTEPATCACGYSTGSILGHNSDSNAATSSACKKCSRCGTITDTSHNYTYTCSSTCSDCGYNRGTQTHLAATDDGNCTTAVKCKYGCGTTVTAAKSHSYSNQCDTTCNNSGCTAGNRTANHNYGSASCTSPATCTVCGQSTGGVLGHNPIDAATSSACKKCSRCGTTTDSSHNYTYTCSSTCSDCGYNRGTQSHNYPSDDGNCTTAVTCSYGCGTVKTAAKAAHSYTNACDASCNNSGCTYTRTTDHDSSYKTPTCTSPGTCSICGAVNPSKPALGHNYGNTTWGSNSSSGHGTAKKTCSRCYTQLSGSITQGVNKILGTCMTATTFECKAEFSDGSIDYCPGHTGGYNEGGGHEKPDPVYGGTFENHSYYECCGTIASSTHSMYYVGTYEEHEACACGYSNDDHYMESVGVSNVCRQCDCGYQDASHNYATSSSTATCTTIGYTDYDCRDCSYGYSSSGSYDYSNHWGSVEYVSTSSKCWEWTCCGYYSSSHSYSSATCTSGSTCRNCGYTKNDSLGHNLSASWTHDDSTVTIRCSRCNESYTDSPSQSVDIQEDCSTAGSYHHYINASMDNTTGYFSCGNSHTIPKLSHVARADDGNCTTAVYCKYGCGTVVIYANGAHNYPTNCTTKCQNSGCNVTRTAPHTWRYTCSTKCSDCSVTRSASHSNTSAKTYSVCQKCTYCGVTTDSTHSYSLSHCDRYCDDCGYDRGSSYTHEYSWSMVSTRFHQGYCGYCGQSTSAYAYEHDVDLTYTPKGLGWSNKHYVDGKCTMCSYSYEDAGPYDCYDNDNSGRCDACNQLCS